jgi:AraC-like DNA-binding protein
MDPLSDILSIVKPRSVFAARLEAGGKWCLRSPALDNLRFGAVIAGGCWLAVEDAPPVYLEAGDSYFLTDGQPYRVGSDLGAPAIEMNDLIAGLVNGVAKLSQVPDAILLGGRFSLDATNRSILFEGLPPVILVRAGSEQASVQKWVLERLAAELLKDEAGVSAMVANLAELLLVQTLRDAMSSGSLPSGWLAALGDPKIGRSLKIIHGDPIRRWTLDSLARAVGMSRSTFALRFKAVVGTSPLDYLQRWRLRLAGRDLVKHNASISEIRYIYGYASESAFSLPAMPSTARSARAAGPMLRSPLNGSACRATASARMTIQSRDECFVSFARRGRYSRKTDTPH